MQNESKAQSKTRLAALYGLRSVFAGSPALALICGLLALTLYRALVLTTSDLSLYFDEAYYWFWSNFPAYGYYSKPPMIAWVIRLATLACGDGEACVRAGALMSFPLTAVVLYLLGKTLFDQRVGVWAAIIFATLPLVSFYSRIMSTDSLLMFCWALALYGLVRALETDRISDWLLTGLALGAGLLSKYTMGFFLLSALIYCVWTPCRRNVWRNPGAWLAIAVAGGVFAPNLIWNGIHGFASFRHTAEIAQWSGTLFHPDKLLEFVGGQFLLFGPILGVALTTLIARSFCPLIIDEKFRLLVAFTLPMLLIYAVQAFLARANLNWAIAAYVPASLLAAACFVKVGQTRMLRYAVIFNLFLGVGLYHYTDLMQWLNVPLSKRTDFFKSMRGWPQLGSDVAAVLTRYPDAGLLCDNRRAMAELIYYVRPHPLDAAIYNPTGHISDHFRLAADVSQSQRQRFVLVAADSNLENLRSRFREIVDLGVIEVPIYPDYALKFHLFLVKHFLGYRS